MECQLLYLGLSHLSPLAASTLLISEKPGNFRAGFIEDLTVKPRVASQPLLAFMDQART